MAHRIMVVDDDERVRSTLQRVLERRDHTVRTHDAGFGLIVAMRGFEPDVVLLDLEMPGLTGDAALRAIADIEHLPFVPPKVILFSGSNEDELARRAAACGAWSYLRKPATSTEILDIVDAAIRAPDTPSAASG